MIKTFKVLILMLPALLSNYAIAEYRVYQYIIKNKLDSQQIGKAIVKVSTLDPVSFVAYNGGVNSVEVDLLRTWLCPGDTSKKDTCRSPYRELSSELLNAKD